ncbi:germ cell nuclear acidic protein isoform X2 [Microplitis demolitor]|uniref:germ cell nuclear acidic protein isoform X2 n=1 Tax=Microplitis demolitor TaxID=69319 RepID=UPI00235B693C|nr:germ cell nuclear acidic protein isoform X2 [Microplitis demolitor]
MGNEKRIIKTSSPYPSPSAKNHSRSIIDVCELDNYNYDQSDGDNSSSLHSISSSNIELKSITRLLISNSIAWARYSVDNLSIKLTLGNLGFFIIIMVIIVPKTFTYFIIYPIFRLLFGTLYPAYASYKAVRTKNVKEYVKWMMYWIVFALFTCAETFTDVFFSFWFPFYYEIKIILVLWLLSPATKGSSILYRRFVHPALIRREAEIDDALARATEQGYTAVLHLGTKGVNYATTVLMQTAIKGGGGLVQQLKKSYSLSDLTGEKEDENRNTSMMHDETDMIEPRRRENPGRRGYSPRRTQSSCNRVDMFFSEVDVDVRQPRPREPISSINNIRSSDDISSGYSSGEAVQTHRMTPHTETLLRTSSVGARTRSSKPRSTAKKLPEDEEDTCEFVDPQLPALSVISAQQSLQLMLFLSQMHSNAPLNYPSVDEILKNTGHLFSSNLPGSILVAPENDNDNNQLNINYDKCDYNETDEKIPDLKIDSVDSDDTDVNFKSKEFTKDDKEEFKKISSPDDFSQPSCSKDSTKSIDSNEFKKLSSSEETAQLSIKDNLTKLSSENNLTKLSSENNLTKLSSEDNLTKEPIKDNLSKPSDLKDCSKSSQDNLPKVFNSEENSKLYIPDDSLKLSVKNNSIQSTNTEDKKVSLDNLSNSNSLLKLSSPAEPRKLSSSHEHLKVSSPHELTPCSTSNVDITKITDEICQEKFIELKRLLNNAHEAVTSIVHTSDNLSSIQGDPTTNNLEDKSTSKTSLLTSHSSASVSRSSSDCDRAGKYHKKPAPRVPSASKSELNAGNNYQAVDEDSSAEAETEQALKATLVIKTGTVKTFTNVNNTKNVFFTHPTTSHRHSSPSVSTKSNKKKKSLSRFLAIPRNLFGNKEKDKDKGKDDRSGIYSTTSEPGSRSRSVSVSSQECGVDAQGNNKVDVNVQDILFKTALTDQSPTSDTYIDFRTDSLDRCDQNNKFCNFTTK